MIWALAHERSIDLGERAVLMGILNVTPDSFSDGGRYDGDVDLAVGAALRMVEEGAAIIDVGGESTRPGAEPVDAATEQARVLPVIRVLTASSRCFVSIDTYRAETARLAIEAGAHIVNDVTGLGGDPQMAAVAARTRAGLCIMHTGRGRERHPEIMVDQIDFLSRALAVAVQAGVERARIVLDPGFGFAKDARDNLVLLRRLGDLRALGHPILVGASRKRFVRGTLGDGGNADIASAAGCVMARERGASIFRVHDIATHRDALLFADAVLEAR